MTGRPLEDLRDLADALARSEQPTPNDKTKSKMWAAGIKEIGANEVAKRSNDQKRPTNLAKGREHVPAKPASAAAPEKTARPAISSRTGPTRPIKESKESRHRERIRRRRPSFGTHRPEHAAGGRRKRRTRVEDQQGNQAAERGNKPHRRCSSSERRNARSWTTSMHESRGRAETERQNRKNRTRRRRKKSPHDRTGYAPGRTGEEARNHVQADQRRG